MKKNVFLILSLVVCVCFQAQAQSESQKSSSIVNIDGQNYYVHTVKQGETIYSLTHLYSVSEEELRSNNPHLSEGLKTDQVLKIPTPDKKELNKRQQARLFDIHTVNQGETAYSISKRYGISVTTLLEDNPGLDPAALPVGQVLNIRKKSIGEQNDLQLSSQWNKYAEAINKVSDGFIYHLVNRGETIYYLTRKYEVTEAQINENNDLSDGLKAGMMIKIPLSKKTVEHSVPDVKAQEVTPPAGDNVMLKERNDSTVKVAMFLPLKVDENLNHNFMEFYQGALIALNDLKSEGISVELNLFNSQRNAEAVREALQSKVCQDVDIIIGPVYEEGLSPAVEYGERNGVPVVSPLAVVEKTNSSVLYQMSPDPAMKYDKLKKFLDTADKNIILVSSAKDDVEFTREIRQILPETYKRLTYAKAIPPKSIEVLLDKERENVFVILSCDVITVDGIMASISSIQNSYVGRGYKISPISIVGSSKLSRLNNVDKNLYFKLRLSYISSYHADRSNEKVRKFDDKYIAAFAMIPSLYSYRGYDATKLFITGAVKAGTDFKRKINDPLVDLLQTSYFFVQKSKGENNVNDQWALVQYNDDYTVNVK